MARVMPPVRVGRAEPTGSSSSRASASTQYSIAVHLAPGQPVVLLDEDGRLQGREGKAYAGRTQITNRMNIDNTTVAESLVPKDGAHQLSACSFDAMSHIVARSIHLNADCSKLEGILQDADASVAVLLKLEQAANDAEFPVNRDGSRRDSHSGAGLWHEAKPRAQRLKALREENEALVKNVVQVLQGAVGPKLVSKLLDSRLAAVETHVGDLKTRRRRKLDSVRATRQFEARKIPAERKHILAQERLEEGRLEQARLELEEITASIDNVIANNQKQFDTLQAAISAQKQRRQEIERQLSGTAAARRQAALSSPDLRSGQKGISSPAMRRQSTAYGLQTSSSNDRDMALRQELWQLKEELQQSEKQLAILKVLVVEGVKKEQLEQQTKIHMLQAEHCRSVEVVRKKRKKLDEQLKESNEVLAEIDDRRIAVEVEFRAEFIKLVAFDRPKEEAALLQALLHELRSSSWVSLRRYAAGQEIVVRLPGDDRDSGATWQDAVVETAATWSYAHRLRLSNGRKVDLTLHPYNHAVKVLECAAWDALRARYDASVSATHGVVRDPFSGADRHILELRVPIEPVDGGQTTDVRTLSEMLHRAYVSSSNANSHGESYPAPSSVLVFAPPGGGKTCMMQQLAVLAVAKQALVPILVRVADLHRWLISVEHRWRFARSWNWVDAYLQCLCEDPERAAVYPMLRQAMMARRALLLIDGVDEGGRETSQLCKHVVEVLQAQGHSVVVTSRPNSTPWPSFKRLQLLPLPVALQREVMLSRLHDETAFNELQKYQAELLPDGDEEQSGLVSSPLLFSMLVSLFEDRAARRQANSPLTLPKSASDLYSAWTGAVMERVGSTLPIYEVLEITALYAHASKRRVITAGNLHQAARALVAKEISSKTQVADASFEVDVKSAVEAIKQLVCEGRLPVLTLLQAEPFEFQFAHLSFQEYFFVLCTCRGTRLPTGMERPWEWSTWWENALSFGIGTGDAFSNGLLEGCRAFETLEGDQTSKTRAGHLDLTKKVGIVSEKESSEDIYGAGRRLSPKRFGTMKDLLKEGMKVLDQEKPVQNVLEDRTIAISAVAEIAKCTVSLNLSWNAITETEMAVIATGVRPKMLTALDVSHNKLGDAGMKTLIGALAANGSSSALRSMNCAHCGVGIHGTAALAQLVSVTASLTQLDMRGNDPTDDGLRALGRALLLSSVCPLSCLRCDAFDLGESVKQLKLKPFLDGSAALTLLSGPLKRNTVVRELGVYDATFGIESSSALASSMATQSSVTALRLVRARIGDAGVVALAQGLKRRTQRNMRTLHIEDCDFGPEGAKALAASLSGLTSLMELGICHDLVRDPAVHLIVEAASALPSLASLNLAHTGTGTTGFKALAALMLKSFSLTSIDVTKNDLRGDSMRAMGQAILKSRNNNLRFFRCDAFDVSHGITELNLRNRCLVSGAAPLLAGLVCHNHGLTCLDLQHNGLGVNGAVALAEGITRSTSIARLNVAKNNLEPAGLIALGRAIGLSKSLTSLDLSSNLLCGVNEDGVGKHTTAGIKVLAAGIARSQLVEVKLDNNGLEVSGAKMFAPALKSCRTLRKISVVRNNLTLFGLNATGVAEIVRCATAGSPYKLSGEVRDLDLSDNHLNKRALAWPPEPVAGISNARAIRIDAPRCRCDYCLMYDEAHAHRMPQHAANLEGKADQGPQGRTAGAWLGDLKAIAESKLGVAISKRRDSHH